MSNSKRQCANWLNTFESWTKPRSEAPISFLFWTGLFALASVLKRRVMIPQKFLGSWNCYPNLFIFFVAPAGGRKTTTIDYLDDLFTDVPGVIRAPKGASQESLFAYLSETKDGSLSIISGEFGNLYKTSTTKLIEFLTAAYDGHKTFDNLTLSRGHEVIINPSVNIITGTTPDWIAENLTPAALKGGFASRVIWVYEEKVRRYQLFYAGLDHTEFQKMRLRLIHDLNHIDSNVSGEVKVEEDVMDYIENWYRNFMEKDAPLFDNRVAGYVQRKPRHALTVATLLRVAYSDDLTLTIEDFNRALSILRTIEIQMPTVFQAVGKNPYPLDVEQIVDYIRRKEKVKRNDLYNRFAHVAQPNVIVDLMAALINVFDRIRYSEIDDSYILSDKEKNKEIPGDDRRTPNPTEIEVGDTEGTIS